MGRRKGTGKRGSGEGSIYKRGSDGRWVGSLSLPDGGRKDLYGDTRAEVLARLDEARRDLHAGMSILSDDRRTLANYLESWLEMRKPSVRPGTLEKYTWHCQHYIMPAIGTVRLSKLTGEHVQRLIALRLADGLARSTVRDTHAVLSNALQEAVRLGIIPRNVALLVKKPRNPRREMHCWDDAEARAFLDAARDDRLYALYVLALSTGMREGELLALRWRDVRLPSTPPSTPPSSSTVGSGAGSWSGAGSGAGSLHVQHTLHWRDEGAGMVMSLETVKTDGSRRQIQLSAMATEALREHRARQHAERLKMGPIWRNHDLVFCNTIGGAIRASNFRRQSFLPLIERAGVTRIRPYDMRHTAATLCLMAGVHPKVVSEMLGHSSVTVTLTIYSHVLPMIQRSSADAMDRIFGRDGVRSGESGESLAANVANSVNSAASGGGGDAKKQTGGQA